MISRTHFWVAMLDFVTVLKGFNKQTCDMTWSIASVKNWIVFLFLNSKLNWLFYVRARSADQEKPVFLMLMIWRQNSTRLCFEQYFIYLVSFFTPYINQFFCDYVALYSKISTWLHVIFFLFLVHYTGTLIFKCLLEIFLLLFYSFTSFFCNRNVNILIMATFLHEFNFLKDPVD